MTHRQIESAPSDLVTRPAREFYLDNLRIALITLVVLHHVAMAYGAGGLAFYYVELPPSGFSRGLLIFVLTNQAWFMGAFFLVAGYFTPGSLDRKGSAVFLRDRLIRLGIPLVLYAVLLNPLAMFGSFFLPEYLTSLTWDEYHYFDYVRMGPMWFVALLAIFSFGYVALRAGLTKSRSAAEPAGAPGWPAIVVFVLALAGLSYLIRLQIPVGKEEWGFPSLAYLPQYLGFYAVGVLARRRDWLRSLSLSRGLVGLAGAALASVFLFPLAFSGKMFSLEVTEAITEAFGGSHWRAAVYALWDSTLAVGLTMGLVAVFRTGFDIRGRFSAFLSRHTYTVYVVHIPVVVFVAVLLRGLEMEHMLKVGLAAVIAVPASFAVAFVVRRLPFADRVL